MSVGAEGTVDFSTGYSMNLPRDLVDCIAIRASLGRFDRPEGGAADVHVPVNLVRQ